ALKDTAKKMTDLLESIQQNLLFAAKGNKAAAQVVTE
nr:Hc1=18 kda histone analog [Chlamydia trachomatis, serotype D, Peptide Partial, 36 aa] [Chlamydia trachomatis]